MSLSIGAVLEEHKLIRTKITTKKSKYVLIRIKNKSQIGFAMCVSIPCLNSTASLTIIKVDVNNFLMSATKTSFYKISWLKLLKALTELMLASEITIYLTNNQMLIIRKESQRLFTSSISLEMLLNLENMSFTASLKTNSSFWKRILHKWSTTMQHSKTRIQLLQALSTWQLPMQTCILILL